jgi:hypothetical protein
MCIIICDDKKYYNHLNGGAMVRNLLLQHGCGKRWKVQTFTVVL